MNSSAIVVMAAIKNYTAMRRQYERKFVCLGEVRAIDFLKAIVKVLATRSWIVVYRYSAESEDGLQYYDVVLCARRIKGTVEFKQLVDEMLIN